MKKINLTRGYTAIIDDSDYEKYGAYKWCALVSKKHVYAIRRIGSKMKYLHRLLLDATGDQEVDHIDGNTLDNRRCNLRICTTAQNNSNRSKNSNSIHSQYKGVTKASGKWKVTVGSHSKNKQVWLFKSEIEAARAYDLKALEIYGDFARLNFPIARQK